MTRPIALLALLLAAGCERCAPPAAPAAPDAGGAAAAAAGDAGAAVGGPREIVVFEGAPGWVGGRACTDVRPDDGCSSQWLHTQAGQVVRVFIVEVAEERALDTFVSKLAADVAAKGGVVDRFTQDGLTLVRFLQPVKSDDGTEPLAAINYALVGRDKRAVHLITSVVPFEQQQAADARVRELLSHAAWTH